MRRAILVSIALGLLAGIASVRGHVEAPLVGALTTVALCLGSRYRRSCGGSVIAALVGIALAHATHDPPDTGDRHTSRFFATAIDARVTPDGRVATTLRLADGTLALANLAPPAPTIGAELVVRGKREPFDVARNPGEPAERDLEAERDLTWRIARAQILARASPDPHDATLWLARTRAAASTRLHAVLGEPGATILAGALWGERGALPPDLRGEFQDTGTVHVLVTAGLHLGVVGAVAYGVFATLGCGRIGASLATIATVWAYAAFSGGHLPSLRAATMLTFALVARAIGRDAFSWNALAAAAIVVGMLRPASVTSLSFALSFSCVAAIFAFARPFGDAFEKLGLPKIACELFGVAFAAQLGTWPLTAATFLVIAPYAPVANALVVPVVGVAMIAGLATLACANVPIAGPIFANVVTSLLAWIEGAVRFFAALPGAHVIATPPPMWTIATYDVALVAAFVALTRGRVRVAIAVVACASALCLWPPHVPDRRLVITAIDVGQADALLIRTPHGHAFLVDAGGRLERGPSIGATSSAEDVGTRTVVPFLIRAGIHRLDAVLLSHPHGDHAGGIAPVLRSLGAEAFADSGQAYPGHAYRDALAVVRDARVPVLEPRGGTVWTTDDGVVFRFYGPTRPYVSGGRNDINDNSLVFRLEYGAFRMLFTGDAGETTERRLLASGVDLRANVLKVGHHGSAYGTSSAFVRAIGASAAIVSVGRDNLFGHPAASTLQTLVAGRARVARTDRDGAVTVTSDGRTWKIDTYLHPVSAIANTGERDEWPERERRSTERSIAPHRVPSDVRSDR